MYYQNLRCIHYFSGCRSYNAINFAQSQPYNIPSSRFFRSYMQKWKGFIGNLKLKSIKRGMTHAAKQNLLSHLCWHSNNFGFNTETKKDTLRKILNHFLVLQRCYVFENTTMLEISSI